MFAIRFKRILKKPLPPGTYTCKLDSVTVVKNEQEQIFYTLVLNNPKLQEKNNSESA